MKTRTSLTVAAAIALFVQGPNATAQDAPIVLAPSSKWVVQMAPDHCSIVREFGTGKDQVKLQLSTIAPDYGFSLSLIGKPAKLLGSRNALKHGGAWVDVSFLPDGPAARGFAYTGETMKAPALVMNGVHRKARDSKSENLYLNGSDGDYSGVDHLYFGEDLKRPLDLQTGSLQAVFGVLDQCKWKQVESWGLDAEANRNRTAPPKMKKGRIRTIAQEVQSTYPTAALNAWAEADIQLRLIVDANGTVTGCRTLSNMAADEFSDIPCKPFLEQTSLYEPATGPDGKPIASWAIQSIRYYIR